MIRVRVVVSGRVQGVAFRDGCRRQAVEHRVGGWVRNLADGSVEAVFEGTPDAVASMVDWARRGPAMAVVTGIDVHEETFQGLDGFVVRP